MLCGGAAVAQRCVEGSCRIVCGTARLGGPRPNLVLVLQALKVRSAIGKCGAGLLLLQAGPLLVVGVALAGLRRDLGVDHCTPEARRCQHETGRRCETAALVRGTCVEERGAAAAAQGCARIVAHLVRLRRGDRCEVLCD